MLRKHSKHNVNDCISADRLTFPFVLTTAIYTEGSRPLVTHRGQKPRLALNQKRQNGSYRLVIPRWSPNVAESAQLAKASRSWAKVSEAAHSAI